MIQTFTQNDLVRHLFTEESAQEADKINTCLAINGELSDNFNDYRSILEELTASLVSPGHDSVNFILEYSRITA